MADWPALKNSAFTVTFPIFDADGDLVSAATALDSEVSIDGGTFTDVTPDEATELATASGVYELDLTAAEMNGDRIAVITKTTSSGAKTAVNVMYTAARQLKDLAFPTTSGRSIDVETTGEVGINLDNVVGTLDAGEIGAGAITAAKFAAGAIDAAALNADAVDEIWDEALSGHATVGTVGQLLNALGARTGEVADVGPTAADFDVDGFTEATDNHFNGHVMVFTSGALLGQSRIISTYTGAAQNCAFDRNWTEAPADNDDFVILGPLAGALARLPVVESDGVAHADVKEWLGTAPLALQSQRVDSYTGAMAGDVVTAAAIANDAIGATEIANAAIDAATFAANAITASALASDAVTEIRSLASGTADSGSTSTLVDAARTEGDTDYWKGAWLLITSGTSANQARLITGFTPGTDTITFAPVLTQAVSTNTYEILPAGSINVVQWLGATVNALVSGAVDADVSAIQGDVITAAAIANAAIDAATFAAGAITATVIATDAIDADALAADAVDEIWNEAMSGHVTAGTFGEAMNEMFSSLISVTGDVSDAGALATDFDTDLTEASDDHYNGHFLVFTGGVLAGQARMIRDYDGTAKNVAFDRAFTEAPGNGDDFSILGGPSSALSTMLARLTDWEGEASVSNRVFGWAVAKLVNLVDATGATLLIKKTDDSTNLFTQTITTDSGADPITVLNTV